MLSSGPLVSIKCVGLVLFRTVTNQQQENSKILFPCSSSRPPVLRPCPVITVQPLNSSCVSTSASLRRPQASNQATGRNTGTVSTVRNTRPLTPPPCTCSQRYSFWSIFATGPTTFFSSSTFNSCGNYLVYFLLLFYPIHYLIFQEKKNMTFIFKLSPDNISP